MLQNYVLLLVLHTCRLHICAAYEDMHAACEQEGTNWSCVHQDFLHRVYICAAHICLSVDMCHLNAAC